MPDTDDTARHSRHESRLSALETTAVELTTIRRMVSGLIIAALGLAGTAAVMIVRSEQRIEALEREVRLHVALPSHHGGAEALADVHTELRVLAVESRQTNSVLSEVRERLSRIEQRPEARSSHPR